MKNKLLLGLFAVALLAVPAHAQHSVALTWVAPSSATSPAAASYNVYRAPGACSSTSVFAKINSSAVVVTGYNDASTALVAGASFCYQVTAVSAAGVEGPASNQVAATIPNPPAAPTSLTVTSST